MWWGIARFGTLHNLGFPGDRLLLLVGVVASINDVRRARWPLPLALTVLVVGMMFTLPASVSRYMLPLVPVYALLQARGLLWLITQGRQLIARCRRVAPFEM